MKLSKALIAALGLALGVSAMAQSNTTSIVQSIQNNAAVGNTAQAMNHGAGADGNGDTNSNCHTGSKGNGAGGNDKNGGCGTTGGTGGNTTGGGGGTCVPEPASLLALGAGIAIVAIKKRRVSK